MMLRLLPLLVFLFSLQVVPLGGLDEGTGIDPWGHPRWSATTDGGGLIDPNGGGTTDVGSAIDPDGVR